MFIFLTSRCQCEGQFALSGPGSHLKIRLRRFSDLPEHWNTALLFTLHHLKFELGREQEKEKEMKVLVPSEPVATGRRTLYLCRATGFDPGQADPLLPAMSRCSGSRLRSSS